MPPERNGPIAIARLPASTFPVASSAAATASTEPALPCSSHTRFTAWSIRPRSVSVRRSMKRAIWPTIAFSIAMQSSR